MGLQDLLLGSPGGSLYARPDPQAAMLAAILGASPASTGPSPAAAPAPVVGQQGTGDINSQIMDLIGRASAPQPTTDIPVPNEPKSWQKVLGAIADAASVYASGLNPAVRPTGTTNYLLGQSDQRKNRIAANAANKKQAQYDSSVKEAEMKLRDLIAQREDVARSADAATIAKEKKAEFDAKQQEAEKQRAFETAQAEKDHAFRMDLERLRNRSEGRGGADPMEAKAAAKEQEHFSVGARIALGFRDGLPADPKTNSPAVPPLATRLAGGESPDSIREQFEEELDKEGIFGKARDLARNYFNQRMIKAAQQAEQQKAAEAAAQVQNQPGPGFLKSGVNAWDSAITGATAPYGR